LSKTHLRTSLKIESALLNAIALHGSENIARAIGIDRSQISKWKKTHIPKFSKLLAAIGYEVDDEDLRRLAKQVAELLIKEMRPDADTPERIDRNTR